jgi:hypothetical protein
MALDVGADVADVAVDVVGDGVASAASEITFDIVGGLLSSLFD